MEASQISHPLRREDCFREGDGMKAQHTPGPWSAYPVLVDGEFLGSFDIRVATVPGEVSTVDCDPGIAYVHNNHCYPHTENRHHENAALIAAAPDLLEALKNIINAAAVGDAFDYPEILAAIAKAKAV
jgi:hypothetical protein